MFEPKYPLARIEPAAYNPRRIDPASFSALRESIRLLGVIRPLIVTHGGRLIAGHQRCRAMIAEGLNAAPVQVLDGVGLGDEVRFNQLHNASDKELVDADIRVELTGCRRWQLVGPSGIHTLKRPGAFAMKLNEVLRLLAKFGEWGNAVVDRSGRVLAGQLYAYGCEILRQPLRVCVVPESQASEIRDRLGRTYGQFSYDHLPRTTWVQSLAQMYRIRSGREARGKSRTYETRVIPMLKRSMRVLDFGAGQMDYVRLLRRRRYRIQGVEFYLRKPGEMNLDLPAIHRHIDALCDSLRRGGLFDLVVCDSVLNSVDSERAQADVLATVNAFCRPGGTIIFSGRCREFMESTENNLGHCGAAIRKGVSFIDDRGFSAMYQRGVWLFQQFHRRAQAEQLGRRFIGADAQYLRTSSSWSVAGSKGVRMRFPEGSIRREFELPLPDGTRLGRSADVLAALKVAQSRAR
jgi:ParB family chromosome partitioning protein